MDPRSPAPRDSYLLVSALIAGIPALVLTAMILITPPGKEQPASGTIAAAGGTQPPAKEESGPARATDKPVEGTFLPPPNKSAPVSRLDTMRILLDKICEDEERMAARMKRVLEEPDLKDPERGKLLSELAHRSAKESLDTASEMLDAAHTIPAGPMRIALYSGVLQTRAEIHAEEALKLCGVLHEREDQMKARNFVVRHWALRDFEAATRAVERLEFPEDRQAASVGLIEALRRDIAPLGKVLARQDLSPEVAAGLAATFGLNWKGSLEDMKKAVATSAKPQVMAQLMAGYAAQRPKEALPFFRENPELELPEEVVARMGFHLAAGNAEESLVGLLEGAEFKSRIAVVKATFSQWMTRDLKAAGEWLRTKDRTLGNAAEADELRLLMFTAMKRGGAKESARAWAERISDAKKREVALREVE